MWGLAPFCWIEGQGRVGWDAATINGAPWQPLSMSMALKSRRATDRKRDGSSLVRSLLERGEIDLDLSLPHALTEARKDGLTTDDLEAAVMASEIVEDYGERLLLLHFVTDQRIPFHVVLEYVPSDDVATIVTAYIPDRSLWESDWKTRKKIRRKKKKR